ncbi:hypothetical protein ZIOFF_072508 [Zingiber officinale]|uniref:Protein kinase domain-containing protein n=1 Tax=Zingiber officinale TaxID=94328 RepID=A0A8J5BUY4_ZINOF|nr:hypothetical protein ZIOFF_072508 [Zingiber officinale]
MACFGIFKSIRFSATGDSPEERCAAVASSCDKHLISSSIAASAFARTTSTTDAISSGKHSTASETSSSQRSVPDLFEERANRLRAFELDELREAIGNFAQQNKIGKGGFGSVYKGFLPPPNGGGGSNIPVAVKKLNQKGLAGAQGMASRSPIPCRVCAPKPSDRTVECIVPHIRHSSPSMELEVVHRFGGGTGVSISARWGSPGSIGPKLSDFGLAREGHSAGQTHLSTHVVGTHGHATPDYIETGHLATKSDAWSFGVVRFEILTGRRSLEQKKPPNEQKLRKEFPVETRKFSMIMDTKLRGNFSLDVAREVARLANRCVFKNPKECPTMDEVVKCLKRAIQMEPKEELSFIHNSNKNRVSCSKR